MGNPRTPWACGPPWHRLAAVGDELPARPGALPAPGAGALAPQLRSGRLLARSHPARDRDVDDTDRMGETQCTVLVIDDDPDTIYVYSHIFSGRGFRVAACSDGAQVVAAARAARPDVILMDYVLPGMNGWDATRALKRHPETGHVPVIAISAYGDPQARIDAIAAGCSEYLEKPVSPMVVLRKVRELVGDSCPLPAEPDSLTTA